MTGDEGDWILQVSPRVDEAEAEAARRVVASGWLTEGREAQAFTEEMNALVGAPFGVLAPNGTLALALALMALSVGPGDEVLVPDITFMGSASAVLLAGARPVFVEVDAVTFQIDIEEAERQITPATRAIMPVHLYGGACDMDAVMAFAGRHGLQVVEDAAQGVGVRYKGRHVGAIGDVGCFSFFADKTVTMGEGGFVVCRDTEVYERLRLLRNQGRINSGTFVHPAVGYNLRITDMQAAIGRVQLSKLPQIVASRLALHRAYQEEFAGIDGVDILQAPSDVDPVPFRCVVLCRGAERLMRALAAEKVQARSFFYPLHRQPAFEDLGLATDDADFPNALMGFRRGVCLPVHGGLSRADVARVAAIVRDDARA